MLRYHFTIHGPKDIKKQTLHVSYIVESGAEAKEEDLGLVLELLSDKALAVVDKLVSDSVRLEPELIDKAQQKYPNDKITSIDTILSFDVPSNNPTLLRLFSYYIPVGESGKRYVPITSRIVNVGILPDILTSTIRKKLYEFKYELPAVETLVKDTSEEPTSPEIEVKQTLHQTVKDVVDSPTLYVDDEGNINVIYNKLSYFVGSLKDPSTIDPKIQNVIDKSVEALKRDVKNDNFVPKLVITATSLDSYEVYLTYISPELEVDTKNLSSSEVNDIVIIRSMIQSHTIKLGNLIDILSDTFKNKLYAVIQALRKNLQPSKNLVDKVTSVKEYFEYFDITIDIYYNLYSRGEYLGPVIRFLKPETLSSFNEVLAEAVLTIQPTSKVREVTNEKYKDMMESCFMLIVEEPLTRIELIKMKEKDIAPLKDYYTVWFVGYQNLGRRFNCYEARRVGRGFLGKGFISNQFFVPLTGEGRITVFKPLDKLEDAVDMSEIVKAWKALKYEKR